MVSCLAETHRSITVILREDTERQTHAEHVFKEAGRSCNDHARNVLQALYSNFKSNVDGESLH